jgi:hypothetical protein
VILDHVDQIGIPDEDAALHANELRSLRYLSEGLAFLNAEVSRLESEVFAQLDPAKQFMLFGNAPGLENVPMGLVACGFHWYAVSACNFVRLVGWLSHGQDITKAAAYVEEVMPGVKLWRDKVAAHFALIDPRSGGRFPDNPADLARSVMFPIAFDDRAFKTSDFTLSVGDGAPGFSSREGMTWSLTETHQHLGDRYWPTTMGNEN